MLVNIHYRRILNVYIPVVLVSTLIQPTRTTSHIEKFQCCFEKATRAMRPVLRANVPACSCKKPGKVTLFSYLCCCTEHFNDAGDLKGLLLYRKII